jgi:hypothetical protein
MVWVPGKFIEGKCLCRLYSFNRQLLFTDQSVPVSTTQGMLPSGEWLRAKVYEDQHVLALMDAGKLKVEQFVVWIAARFSALDGGLARAQVLFAANTFTNSG